VPKLRGRAPLPTRSNLAVPTGAQNRRPRLPRVRRPLRASIWRWRSQILYARPNDVSLHGPRAHPEDEYVRLLEAAGWKPNRAWYPADRMIGIIEGRCASRSAPVGGPPKVVERVGAAFGRLRRAYQRFECRLHTGVKLSEYPSRRISSRLSLEREFPLRSSSAGRFASMRELRGNYFIKQTR
jgi:hypothetical protein